MTLQLTLVCHLLGLGVLRCASLLVPGTERAEWWKEWRSELWHVRQACVPSRGISWSAEREVAAFCIGAFEDARCLRKHMGAKRLSHAMTMGSAAQCLLLMAGLATVSYGISLLLPGLSALIHPPRYRDGRNLMLVQEVGQGEDSIPTISVAQYQTWKRRRQEIFDGFAFYQVTKGPALNASHHEPTGKIVYASSNLFELLGLTIRFALSKEDARNNMPMLILSDETWKKDFYGDPRIAGHVMRIGTREVVVGGVAPEGAWRLPGRVAAWMLLTPDDLGFTSSPGYVLAHLKSSEEHAQWSASWRMSAPMPDGSVGDFLCVSLMERTRRPWDIYLFAIILACLALPATTSLPLGEYKLSSRKLSWSTRLRRWSFLGSKITLLLPIAYFGPLNLAYLHAAIDPISSQYIQLVSAFSICLFGLRWSLRDQRQRCPVCLGKLTHPARVGQPSRSFLDWNGTELICVGGHGLLHVPEMPTSWFSTQRWLYLDSSWEILFAESGLAAAGYF